VSQLKIYSYKITRDFGFAPNPFPPHCTLATCKPGIRRTAKVGDWVVGVGSSAKNSKFRNKLIYAMQVHEKLSYDEYWIDPRFKKKRPVMNGSKRQMYGDNIYHRPSPESPFIQEDSHHSLQNGEVNRLNYERDLPGKYVLIAKDFWYFGEDAILIPQDLLPLANVGRGYKLFDEKQFVERFKNWLDTLPESGYLGRPHMFNKGFVRYSGK
jgi:hypothetical protein